MPNKTPQLCDGAIPTINPPGSKDIYTDEEDETDQGDYGTPTVDMSYFMSQSLEVPDGDNTGLGDLLAMVGEPAQKVVKVDIDESKYLSSGKCLICGGTYRVHTFPKFEGKQRRKWLEFVGRLSVPVRCYICYLHFDPSVYINSKK